MSDQPNNYSPSYPSYTQQPSDLEQNRNQNLVQSQPMYQPQTPPMMNYSQPQKKGKGLLIFIVIFIISILVIGGSIGAYFFFDYSNKQNTAKEINTILNNNYEIYTDLSDRSVKKLKELENFNRDIASIQPTEVKTLASDLETKTNELKDLIDDHDAALKTLKSGPNSDVDSYTGKIKSSLNDSQNQLEEITKGYEFLSCYNNVYVNFTDIYATAKTAESKVQQYIKENDIDGMVKILEQMAGVFADGKNEYEKGKTCFKDNGNIVDSASSIKSMDNGIRAFGLMEEGYRDMIEAIEQEDLKKLNLAEQKISSVTLSGMELKENPYAVFKTKMLSKFNTYYDSINLDKKDLKAEQGKIQDQFKVRDSFFGI